MVCSGRNAELAEFFAIVTDRIFWKSRKDRQSAFCINETEGNTHPA